MAQIVDLQNAIIAWWSFEDTPSGRRYVDGKAGHVLTEKRPVETNFEMPQITGAVGKAIGNFELHHYLVNDVGRKFKLPKEDFAFCFWYHVPWVMPLAIPRQPLFAIADYSGGISLAVDFELRCNFLKAAAADPITPNQATLEFNVGPAEFAGVADSDVSLQHTMVPGNWYFVTVNVKRNDTGSVYLTHFEVRGSGNTGNDFTTGYQAVLPSESDRQQTKTYLFSVFNDYLGSFADEGWVYLDELVFFDRALTKAEQDWLYNEDNGRAYSDVPTPSVAATVCAKEIKCCNPDPKGYRASASEVANLVLDHLGQPGGSAVSCLDEIEIIETPPSGSCVMFPTYVGLTADDDRAAIHYTVDGTDPETAIGGSTLLYSGPITVSGPGVVVKYRAVVSGCEDYPVHTARYKGCVPHAFSWLCLNPDMVGQWGQWVPNGNNDHNWQWQFQMGTDTLNIDRIELYELDEELKWTTGQAWATNTPIYPFPTVPDFSFDVYPLWVEEAAVPIVNNYTASVGPFTGTHVFDLFGDIRDAAPTNHYFQLKVFTQEHGVIESIIPADTCTPPVVPGATITTTLTPSCALCVPSVQIDFSFTAGQAGGIWSLWRTLNCDDPTSERLVELGDGTVGAHSVTDNNLPPYCNIEYRLEYAYPTSGLSNYNNSVTTGGCPTVAISLDKSAYNHGENVLVTVTWQNFVAGGGCPAEMPVTLNGAPWFTIPDNASGTTTVPMPASDGVDGTNTVEVTACNGCGTDAASATFTLNPAVATCIGTGVTQMLLTQAVDPNFLNIPVPIVGPPDVYIVCTSPGATPWDARLTGGDCLWTIPGGNSTRENSNGDEFKIDVRIGFSANITGAACAGAPGADGYWMRIYGCANGDPSSQTLLWQGYKTSGTTPVGTYTFLGSMCLNGSSLATARLSGPATLSIEAI